MNLHFVRNGRIDIFKSKQNVDECLSLLKRRVDEKIDERKRTHIADVSDVLCY